MQRIPRATFRAPRDGTGCLPARGATRFVAILLLLVAAASGCAGYHVGTPSLYDCRFRTVYVPIFDSVSYRRNLGERLTEAVIKEIELKTTYKVVGRPPADTILTGRIVDEGRSTVIPSPVGGPRDADLRLAVEVAWIDSRGQVIRESGPIDLPTATERVTDSADVLPEYGQSIATGQQQAIHRVAEQIVAMMEVPW